MPESPAEAYDRGETAGGIAARLAGHDQHFASINGSLARIAAEMHALTLAVQRLGDQAESRDATVIATAKALKEAEETRRQTSERAWSPFARASLIIGIVATVVATGLAIYVAVQAP